jgi:hypothetical protein
MDAEAPKLPSAAVPPPAPVKTIKSDTLAQLAERLSSTFDQYKNDRRSVETQWIKNLRQYLGKYDPEVERELPPGMSRAYPRLTRVKLISVVSRLMNLMFPGHERNWEIKASPSADMAPEDVAEALQKAQAKMEEKGLPPELDDIAMHDAIQRLADERAEVLSRVLDDQLQELGGDQTCDYTALNRRVLFSGALYGVGLLRGPFVREVTRKTWSVGPDGRPTPIETTAYKPQYEFLPVWDFYPDMAAKDFQSMDGYFLRLVMSRGQLRKLADREDFLKDQITHYLKTEGQRGNFKSQPFETDLRSLGASANVNPDKADSNRYEILVWHGLVSAGQLIECGAEVPEAARADDVEAEIWMVGGKIIKADINPWRALGLDVRTIHAFSFDEDDSSIFGNGMPAVVRDSQMSVCAAARMLLDNASVVCGPQLEVNIDRVQPQINPNMSSIHAHKLWFVRGDGVEGQYPAIRSIQIESRMDELLKIIDLFMRFMDAETFVGPATGGDMDRGPSEPFRTATGASMLRGEAALPFKDIVRNFDTFTQSVVYSLVQFNRKFNADKIREGDYDVIARGATSLIAKEIRGAQLDQLAQTLGPEDFDEVDRRKFIEARFASRDLQNMLLPPDEARLNKQSRDQQMSEQLEQQREMIAAQVRETLAGAFKDIALAQKNLAMADKVNIEAAGAVLQKIAEDLSEPEDGDAQGAGAAA